MRRWFPPLLLAVTLAGCAYTKVTPPPAASALTGPAPERYCVMPAADGSYGDQHYARSGRMVGEQVLAAVRVKFFGSELADTTDEHAAARDCADKGITFLCHR